jgi:hypothetical protein
MHQGQFKTRCPSKYLGDSNNIYYRSSWEFSLMMWCDTNDAVVSWSSEEVVIPYLCPTDNTWHRYFIDFCITMTDGKKFWIELKPDKYTRPPLKPNKSTKSSKRRHITEVYQFIKNTAKWTAAKELATKNGATFQVWTENTLQRLGIKVLGK